MRMSVRSLLIALLAVLAVPAFAAEPAFPDTMVARYHLMVPMRDGVRLATDVYRPSEEGQFPTLLVRDIYTNGSAANRQRYARWATENGYAFVFQSARGRYDSEGSWYPYFQEIPDGEDTIDWIAEQPWSNGKVGMFGTSYLASVQWLAALNRNPALVAIAPAMSPGDYYRDVAYPGGAFSLLSRASWGIGTVGSRTNQAYPIDWIGGIEHLPLATLDESVGFYSRHFRDWLAHPDYDGYWKPLNLEARAPEMSVPALNIGGWYDVFLRSTIGSFTTMREQAATEEARRGQRLVIGPWVHGWNQRPIGEVDFGPDAVIDAEALQLEWFDHWMKGGPAPSGAPVRIFVMGENAWRDEQEWPLARTRYTDYYLHADARRQHHASGTARPLRSGAPRRSSGHHPFRDGALRGGHGDHRARARRALGDHLRQGHGLHGQTGGGQGGRARAEFRGWRHQSPLPGRLRDSEADRARPGLSLRARSLGDELRPRSGRSAAGRRVEQQLPAVGAQPEHR
jgi:putative CocE/NonD family hydrolase